MKQYISRNHRLLENMVRQNSDESNREKRLLMVFPLDIAAHYLCCLELCKKLKDQFEISFAHSLKYDSFVRNCGFETFKVENFNSEEVTAAASNFDFSWLNLPNIELVLNSQINAIEEHKPDLVLGDAAFTLKMAAEKPACPMSRFLTVT